MNDVLEPIRITFSNHLAYWADKQGMVNDQLMGGERALTQQYQGRVPFELVQNGLDRCERHVLAALTRDALIVANDGRPVSFNEDFKHEQPIGEDNRPSDFHALCSVHTSNKSPEEDYGNKGVGFRSVFSVADWVRVWTRRRDGGWWGLELHRVISAAAWRSRQDDPDVRRGCDNLVTPDVMERVRGEAPRPSFHFPLPLLSDALPVRLPDAVGQDWQTLVVLPLRGEGARKQVASALDSLERAHLDFVRLRKPGVEVIVHRADGDGEPTMGTLSAESSTVAVWKTQDATLLEAAKAAGLEKLRTIRCAARWPAEAADRRGSPLIYCYLPSEVPSELGFDLHADFQLGIDRTHLDLKPEEAVGSYNARLIERGVEVHLALALQHLDPGLADEVSWRWIDPSELDIVGAPPVARADVWRFLDPGGDFFANRAKDARRRRFVETLREHLFGSERHPDWRLWAHLAAAYFDGTGRRPARAYADFWRASQHWLETYYPGHYKATRELADACLEALREAGASVVPIAIGGSGEETDGEGDRLLEGWVPPKSQTGSGRPELRIFQLHREDDDEGLARLEVPSAVRDRQREVTSWKFPRSFLIDRRLRGTVDFDRPNLLRELRQLPNSAGPDGDWELEPLHADLDEARRRQEALLRFAAQLFVMPVKVGAREPTRYQDEVWPPGWRAGVGAHDTREQRRMGRAVATLFLPLEGGGWAPARQCRLADVAQRWRHRLQEEVRDLDVEAFLTFLGVCNWAGELPLVEGGEAGLVPVQPVPPDLCAAGSGPVPALEIPLGSQQGLSGAVEAAADTAVMIDGQKLSEALGEAWQAGWLAELAAREAEQRRAYETKEKEKELPPRLAVTQALSTLPWYPVGEGGAEAPAGYVGTAPGSLAPQRLTLSARFNPLEQVLWRVRPKDDLHRGWLEALGASRLDACLENPAAAVDLVEQLLASYPAERPILDEAPRARLGLVQLQQQILDAVVKRDGKAVWKDELPLLMYDGVTTGEAVGLASRPLRWGRPDELWVAPDNAVIEQVRRFFPQVPLLAATLGSQQIKDTPLEGRGVEIKDRIVIDEEVKEGLATATRTRIAAVLAELLAIAEVSRRYVRPVDVAEVAGRWSQTHFIQARDVWRTWELHRPGGFTPADDRKGVFWDVMDELKLEEGRPRRVIGSDIYFDADNGRPPPLNYFASALARALLDGTIEPDWSAALSELEAGGQERLHEFLARHGAEGLVATFRQQLKPLSKAELEQHRLKVDIALAQLGLRLEDDGWNAYSNLRLGPEDVEGGDPGLSEAQIDRALTEVGWTDRERPFAPRFSCRRQHLATWKTWLGSDGHHVRLLRWAHEKRHEDMELPRKKALLTGDLARDLDTFAHEQAAHLRFDPESVARAWLGSHAPDGPLDDALPPLVRFSPITRFVEAPSLARVGVDAEATVSAELRPQTDADRQRVASAKAAKGGAAEDAVLDWVVSFVRQHLERGGDPVWAALLSAVPASGRLRGRLERAQRTGDPPLREVLAISEQWGSAGFDVLSVENVEGGYEPVRYEVKALPPEATRIRVFLSRNELAVARAVTRGSGKGRHSRGRWVLLGVRADGDALDLTGALEPVLGSEAGPLAALAQDGFRPDGLELTIELSQGN